tara:strand:+ start:1881 stop:2168 length:288 start_codon:yes stop_codon:yes gene_type:complete
MQKEVKPGMWQCSEIISCQTYGAWPEGDVEKLTMFGVQTSETVWFNVMAESQEKAVEIAREGYSCSCYRSLHNLGYISFYPEGGDYYPTDLGDGA